ncbi:hypothetical protein [Desulfofundulus sp.]|uniref:hypothetical protein n=1 Tax=Desulfofundulus sp. TaxID=2282750 RepID=UPI003C70AAF4
MEEGLAAHGSFVAVNNRVSQSIPHLHVHIVPRRKKRLAGLLLAPATLLRPGGRPGDAGNPAGLRGPTHAVERQGKNKTVARAPMDRYL